MSSIYLDYNATTPADPRVIEAMLPYLTEHFGNTQSAHEYGWNASRAVETARTQVAALIGAESKEIVFTSSATESNNWVVMGLVTQLRKEGFTDKIHVITSPIEHASVLESLEQAKVFGLEFDTCSLDKNGTADVASIKKLIKPNTKLISIMWANNEVGSINPVKEICSLAKENKIYFHCDATQTVGKLPVSVEDVPVDLMTLTAHKIFGPKGIGALYIRSKNPKVSIAPFIHGGGHEKSQRSGTMNVPGIVGFGMAAKLLKENLDSYLAHYKKLQNLLWSELSTAFPLVKRNSPENGAPNILNLNFENYILPANFSQICVSRASACSTGKSGFSHVLKAIGLSEKQASKSIRFSFGKDTTEAEIRTAIDCMKREIKPIPNSEAISSV